MGSTNPTYIIGALCLAFSLAMVGSFYIRNSSGNPASLPDIGLHIYMTLLLFISIVLMLKYMCLRMKIVGTRMISEHAREHHQIIISKVAKGGLITFFLGTLLFDMVCIISLLDCVSVYCALDCHKYSLIVVTVYLAVKVFFMGLQVCFLFSEGYVQTKHGRSDTSRHVFVLNSIVNLTLIFYTAMYRTVPLPGYPGLNCTIANTTFSYNEEETEHVKGCLTHTTHLFFFSRQIGPYLYPFHSEYSIIALMLNLVLWKCYHKVTNPSDHLLSAGGTFHRDSRDLSKNEAAASDNEDDDDLETSPLVRRLEAGNSIESSQQRHLSSSSLTIQDHPEALPTWTIRNQLGYGAAENTNGFENLGERTGRNGFCSIFKECAGCTQCLDPRPKYIYGPDNGCGIFAFFGFALLGAYTVPMLLSNYIHLNDQLYNGMYIITLILLLTMLAASVLLSIGIHKKLALGPEKCSYSISVGTVVVVFSAFITFLFNFLSGIAAWDLNFRTQNATSACSPKENYDGQTFSPTVQNVLDIISLVVDCAEVALQTNIIINNNLIMKRNYYYDVIYTSTMMQCMSFLMAANTCRWLLGSLIEMHQPQLNYGQCIYYGEASWKAIVYLLYPLVIYYRFHCALAFGEYMLWRRARIDTGQTHIGRANSVPCIGTLAI